MTKEPKIRTELQKFLNAHVNTRTRERIFFNKLYFDVKLAAARHGYPLTVFEPEVDRDGFDVVLDDADNTKHLQLKSKTRSSGTAQWDTTPRFLRPNLRNIEGMGFELSPQGEGLGGGVVMICIDDCVDSCLTSYFYTDLFVIAAFEVKLIKQVGTRQTRCKQATLIMKQLRTERNRGARIKLPLGVFVKVKSPDCLLSIVGLHSLEESGYAWSHNLLKAYNTFKTDESGNPANDISTGDKAHAYAAASGLLTLVNDKNLITFCNATKDYDQSESPLHSAP